MKNILPIFALLLLGCGSPWKPISNVDTPFVAADKKSQLFEKDTANVPAPSKRVVAISDSRGRKLDLKNIFETADQFLQANGILEEWPTIQANINGEQQRVAPYKIHLVSIEPDIIVLIPHNYGELNDNSIRGIVGDRPEYASYSKYLINHIFIGSKIPFSKDTQWFCPTAKIGVSSLALDDTGTGTIQVDDVTLTLEHVDDHWEITRK